MVMSAASAATRRLRIAVTGTSMSRRHPPFPSSRDRERRASVVVVALVVTHVLGASLRSAAALRARLVLRGNLTETEHERDDETAINVTSSVAPSADETLICVNPVS